MAEAQEDGELAVVRECLGVQTLNEEAAKNVLGVAGDKPQLELLYGDTPAASVVRALEAVQEGLPEDAKLKGDGSEVFVDIGSGRGHVCLAAAAAHNWAKCAGVELVAAHVAEARKSIDKLRELEAAGRALRTPADNIEITCADALKEPRTGDLVKEATLVYCFDLAFPAELRREFAKMFAYCMKEGALLLVTHMDPLPSADFVQEGKMFTIDMEWGAAPARLYRKGPGAFERWLGSHRAQLEKALVPEPLWAPACVKMLEQSFDIGRFVQFAQVDGTEDMVMVATRDMSPSSEVFLVDHCFSFSSSEDAVKALATVPGLAKRVLAMAGAAPSSDDATPSPAEVLQAAKGLLASYTVVQDASKPDETSSVYYMLDEIGSRLRRSRTGVVGSLQEGEANMRVVPVFSHDYRMAFSLAWPTRPVSVGDVLFAEHEQGWDLDQVELPSAHDGDQAPLPEMKEFAAQRNLLNLIQASAAETAGEAAAGEAEASGEADAAQAPPAP